MRLNNIEYVVEVIKPKDRPTTVGLKLLSQKEREDHIRVNNSYLCESGVNLHDVAYRMALVLGCDLSDDALRTNCVVSTWFTTGQAKWILKSCLCQTGQWLANLLPLPQRVSKTARCGHYKRGLEGGPVQGRRHPAAGQTRCLRRLFKRSLEDHCGSNACLDNSLQELRGSQVHD